MDTEKSRQSANEAVYGEIFNQIRSDREGALALYNALAGTDSKNPDDILVTRHPYSFSLSKKGEAEFYFLMED